MRAPQQVVRRHIVVRGRVQGVGFRYTARDAAVRLGVAGWVQNLPDGAVEAEVEGAANAVGLMLTWLRRGPRGASVTGIAITDTPAIGETGFHIVG